MQVHISWMEQMNYILWLVNLICTHMYSYAGGTFFLCFQVDYILAILCVYIRKRRRLHVHIWLNIKLPSVVISSCVLVILAMYMRVNVMRRAKERCCGIHIFVGKRFAYITYDIYLYVKRSIYLFYQNKCIRRTHTHDVAHPIRMGACKRLEYSIYAYSQVSCTIQHNIFTEISGPCKSCFVQSIRQNKVYVYYIYIVYSQYWKD